MKKFLNVLLVSIMSVVMVLFVACDTGSTTTPYSGKYVETDAAGLYEAISSVNVPEFEPTEDQNTGLSIDLSIDTLLEQSTNILDTTTQQTDTVISATSSSKIAINGNFVSSLADDEIVFYANLKVSSKSKNTESVNNNDNEFINNVDGTLYIDANEVFAESNQYTKENDIEDSFSSKTKTDTQTLFEMLDSMLSGLFEGMDPSLDMEIPSQEEIIAQISNLSETFGIRFSLDTNKGTKIKLDISDKEKLINLLFSNLGLENGEKNANINKAELYLVFDEEGNFSALKVDMDIRIDYSFSETNPEMQMQADTTTLAVTKLHAEIKFFDGNVSIPEINPDDYTEIPDSAE